MNIIGPRRIALLTACLAVTAQAALARVDVKVEHDKAFNFKAVQSWGWNATGPGEVKMARTKDDDPEAMTARVQPTIVDAVQTEMSGRGLQRIETAPDLVLTYYLLLTTNMSTQTMGQFLPATVAWGLPPFAQSTQSLEMVNRGSLVLDLSAKGTVVWRGVAQAQIKMDTDEKKRQALLREGVRDLLRRYPPKS